MAIRRKDGYKFSDTALGMFIESEKERVGKFRFLGWIFAFVFGGPILFLVLALLWKGVKWALSIPA